MPSQLGLHRDSIRGYTSWKPGLPEAAALQASKDVLICARASGMLCWSSHREYCTTEECHSAASSSCWLMHSYSADSNI